MLNFMVEKLCNRIEESRKLVRPMPMHYAYMCLTTDVITLYALNHSWNLLDTPDFAPYWLKTLQATEALIHLMRHFNFLLKFFRALPPRLVELLNPGMSLLLQFQKVSLSPYTYKSSFKMFLIRRHTHLNRHLSLFLLP